MDDLIEEHCARCGRAIITTDSGHTTHLAADGFLSRGCRAASFTAGNGWDDTIPRRWLAKRPKPV